MVVQHTKCSSLAPNMLLVVDHAVISLLQEIQHKHRDVAGACLTAMLEHWLTQTYPLPSWSALIEALRSPALFQGEIACMIEMQWHIKEHPMNVLTKVGEDAKFFIVTSPGQVTYDWCFNDQSISVDNVDYRGAKTSEMVVLKSLSKHCGNYKCIATHKLYADVHVSSFSAVLEIGILFIHCMRDVQLIYI